MTSFLQRDVEQLRDDFRGILLPAGAPGYDGARELFNAMIDRRPALIAQCATPGDVAAALRLAREHDLPVAVRAGGHSVAGMSMVDDGVVIDVRPMDAVAVDPVARVATVGAGATWAAFDRAAQVHGLATTGGRVSCTGVAGLTLGGGSGWLERKHGLTCDNLLAVELVTADGALITASEDQHPELFWALHGGGGNFGVATRLTFRLHPVGPTIVGGLLLFAPDRAEEALRGLRDHMVDAPAELGTAFVYLTAPDEDWVPRELVGETAAAMPLCHGTPAQARRDVAVVRGLAPAAADLVEPMPYADLQCFVDDPPGLRNWWTAEYLGEMTDGAVDAIARTAREMPTGASQSFLVPWGGAVARPDGETPLARRDATWVVHPFALWDDCRDDEAHIAWARGQAAAVRPWSTGGVYLNFIGDEGEDRIAAAFGPSYARLAEVKRAYDPDNILRLNHNVRPRPAVSSERPAA